MSLKIAETTFITKQGSGLAAVDAYEEQDKVSEETTSIIGALDANFKAPNLQKQIDKVTSFFDESYKNNLSVTDMVGKINDVLKNKDTLVDSIKEAVSTDILTHVGLGKYAGDINDVIAGRKDPRTLIGVAAAHDPRVKVLIDGAEKVVKLKDVRSLNDTVNLLKDITGNSKLAEVFELGPDFLLMSEMLDRASATRIPELVDAVLKVVKEGQSDKILITSIPRIINNSDLDTLKKVEEYLGAGGVLAAYPEAVNKILRHYKTKSDDGVSLQEAQELKSGLDKIKPNWWLTERNNTPVINFGVFEGISSDALQGFNMLDEFNDFTPIVNLYKTQDLYSVIKESKPWIVLA